MTLTAAQRAAAEAKGNVAVTAGAGTGKTHMLAERYVHHLHVHDLSPLEIVAVTFTEKAAAEMRQRIRERVLEALPDRTDLQSELEAATIGTIHALAARICREHPEAAGVAPDFTVLDEQEGEVWMAEQLDLAIEQLPEAIFTYLPFATLREVLQTLLSDPPAADAAFCRPVDDLEAIAKREAFQAAREVLSDASWQASVEVLQRLSGAPTDRIELRRLEALTALKEIAADFAAGNVPETGFLSLAIINLQYGSAKNWPTGGFERVKHALKYLRDQAKDLRDSGLLSLVPGPKDEAMRQALPLLFAAYRQVQQDMATAKRNSRQLGFADLEVGALRALANPEVQAYYAHRWKAFIVDEFQDTNPVQAELLERLRTNAHVTIVGDEKQAIYGFRGADVRVFKEFRERIEAEGGDVLQLARSYRMHGSLVSTLNGIFEPVLGKLHSSLEAHRERAPHGGPHVRYIAITAQNEREVSKPERERAEAKRAAAEVKRLFDQKTLVHDKRLGSERPIQPGDIAVLARTWGILDVYADALAAAGIPAVLTGGGSLLETREALDGWALIQFLADPHDSLSLGAVLRSPFFAISDKTLFQFAAGLPGREASWWRELKVSSVPELARARDVLSALVNQASQEAPHRLLQKADRLCAYTAVLAAMPGAQRRLADWRGFCDLIRKLERGSEDVFQTMRRLRKLLQAEVKFPRPMLEASGAVALMTIHSAKGLEWPVVLVPDLTRRSQSIKSPILLDSELGVALRMTDEDGDDSRPVLYQILRYHAKRREGDEQRRVSYVALTRARDHLLLTGASKDGGAYAQLLPGLEAAGVPMESAKFNADDATPPQPPAPPVPAAPSLVRVEVVGAGLAAIPVTGLVVYETCPRRFDYQFIKGHPGYFEGPGRFAARVGTLVHAALEQGLKNSEDIKRLDPGLPPNPLADAVALVRRFAVEPAFAPFRVDPLEHERPFALPLGRLVLNGQIDAIGPGYVVDFKTDSVVDPHHHRLQLWAYARVTGVERAHLLYLRSGVVHTFEATDLAKIGHEAEALADGIACGRFDARPSAEACQNCPYNTVCDAALTQVQVEESHPLLRSVRSRLPVAPRTDQDWQRVLTQCQPQTDPAEIWRLAHQAPLVWAAQLLAQLNGVAWTPAIPEESEVYRAAIALALQCDMAALTRLQAPTLGPSDTSVRQTFLVHPHEAEPAQIGAAEALLSEQTLAQDLHTWLSLWHSLARWHGRYEVEIGSGEDEFILSEFDIQLLIPEDA